MTPKQNPLVYVGFVVTVVLVFLRALGVAITPDDESVVREYGVLLTPFITALVGRFFVASPAFVEKTQNDFARVGATIPTARVLDGSGPTPSQIESLVAPNLRWPRG